MLATLRDELARGNERIERELRGEIAETARIGRSDVTQQLGQFQQVLATQLTSVATLQNNQIDTFAQQLTKLTETNTQQLEAVRQNLQQQAQQARDEQGNALRRFGETMQQQLAQLGEGNERRLAEVRATLEQKLKDIEANNATKLDEMRRTVDEKLHATLEQRLGESFKLVSDRLEQVHRGLGEMQALAQGVGDLKKVLTNEKTRGTWGEVQLEMLLEQMLTPEQYDKNVETVHGTGARVEFAIRLPGKTDADHDATVWLPIDAKFPKEQYERLLDAQERADADAAAAAADLPPSHRLIPHAPCALRTVAGHLPASLRVWSHHHEYPHSPRSGRCAHAVAPPVRAGPGRRWRGCRHRRCRRAAAAASP